MADLGNIGADTAVTFMVSAGLVYEIVAAACSSPQTTEINAGARSETLMKWVNMGLGQAALFVGIAACLSPEPKAALAGGGIAAVLLYGQYVYANACGLKSDKPGTEQY